MWLGYEQLEKDQCVFRKIVKEKVFYITVYADDLLILADQEEFVRLKSAFNEEFRWITIEEGKTHSYLGMQLTFETG